MLKALLLLNTLLTIRYIFPQLLYIIFQISVTHFSITMAVLTLMYVQGNLASLWVKEHGFQQDQTSCQCKAEAGSKWKGCRASIGRVYYEHQHGVICIVKGDDGVPSTSGQSSLDMLRRRLYCAMTLVAGHTHTQTHCIKSSFLSECTSQRDSRSPVRTIDPSSYWIRQFL